MAEVLQGEDGFLFVGSDGNNYLPQLTGQATPSSATLDRILYAQVARYLFCREVGARYVWALVPGKERVLSEKLPPETRQMVDKTVPPIKRLLSRAVEQGLASVAKNFLYDLANAFHEFTPREGLYHRTDTHWTHTGALLAYQYLIRSLADPLIGMPITRPRASDAFQQGDLATLAGLGPEKIKHLANPLFGCKRVFDNNIENNGKVEVFRGRYSDRPTALILRSSSIDFMKEFFLDHFSSTVMIFGPDLCYELLLNEAPDYVFHFQQERYLLRVPQENESKFLSESAKQKNKEEIQKELMRSFIEKGGYFLNRNASSRTAEIFLSGRI